MAVHQRQNLLLAVRLPVAQAQPHRDGQAQLRRHDFRIPGTEAAPADEKLHQPLKIPQDILIIHLGLQTGHTLIAELLDQEHFPRLADLRIMEDIADLGQNIPRHRFRRDVRLPGREGRILPPGTGKQGAAVVLRPKLLQETIQNLLLAGEMAVKRRLADAHGVRDLRKGRGLIALGGKKIQRRREDLLLCVAAVHCAHLRHTSWDGFIIATER